ncbi:MAG: PIN domain-containing protein [Trueperaceae bacterium]|nr:PIN domain-containing protein [Trueperaceae bacterium]
MIGLDTSYVVALAVREHPAHDAAWRLFETEIRGRDGSMALTPQVLTEFAHVVSDPRRFERPLVLGDALSLSARLWQARECRQVAAGADAVSIFLDWMTLHGLGRKRLLDTMLAATYRAAGVERLASTDWRDFELFDTFEVVRIGGASAERP